MRARHCIATRPPRLAVMEPRLAAGDAETAHEHRAFVDWSSALGTLPNVVLSALTIRDQLREGVQDSLRFVKSTLQVARMSAKRLIVNHS